MSEVSLIERINTASQSQEFYIVLEEYGFNRHLFLLEFATDEFDELPYGIQEAILAGEREIFGTSISPTL